MDHVGVGKSFGVAPLHLHLHLPFPTDETIDPDIVIVVAQVEVGPDLTSYECPYFTGKNLRATRLGVSPQGLVTELHLGSAPVSFHR